MQSNKIPIKLGSEHLGYKTSRFWYTFFVVLNKAFFGFIGVYISLRMYNECLHCNDCNDMVIVHFSVISLCCLSHIGIDIQKISNITTLTN